MRRTYHAHARQAETASDGKRRQAFAHGDRIQYRSHRILRLLSHVKSTVQLGELNLLLGLAS